MTVSQWDAFAMTSGAAVAGSLKYVPDPPASTRPAITVVAPPPVRPAPPVVAMPAHTPEPTPPPAVPVAAAVHEAPKGHHFLVYVGMGLMFVALAARVADTLLHLNLLGVASFRAMALGAVVFVLGRMIRLEIH
jgi:hypothetical protein